MAELAMLTNVGRLWTSTAAGVVPDAQIIFDSHRIRWLGRAGAQPPQLAAEVSRTYDARGGLATPGLIDAHTHPVYLRPRLDELDARSRGADYTELAAGGGIGRTVRETRAARAADLERAVAQRLQRFLRAGTTTVEAKTGYHLTIEGEHAALELLARLATRHDVPALHITYLAAHDVPAELASDRSAWLEQIRTALPAARDAGARGVDIFCDADYFDANDALTLAAAARQAGLEFRLHADELADVGAAEVAARVGARSADHLLEVSARGAAALAAAGVVATVCPLTAVALRKPVPVRRLRDAGVVLALGSDHNPGQTGVTSMATVVWCAIATAGLSVGDALLAATTGSARSLGLDDRGRIAVGARPDIVVWDAPHEGAFAWHPALDSALVLAGGFDVAAMKSL